MGKKDSGRKGFPIWKWLFVIIFLLLSILWVLYTIFYFGMWSDGWEWVLQIPGMQAINEYITSFVNGQGGLKKIGFEMFLISIAVLLVYTTIFFPIKKIPLFGGLLKTLTGIIPALATLVLIIGCIFIWGNIDLSVPGANALLI